MKRTNILNKLLCLFALIGIFLAPACFATASNTRKSPFFPFVPRVSLDGSASFHGTDSTSGLFYGDTMAPIYGSQDGILYVDATGKYDSGDEAYMFSFGAGARKIFDNIIWGGYAFADRSYTADDVRYWVANPGVEVIAPLWDVHVNGYWPISERCKTEGIFYGDQIGISDTVQFTGHDEFDNLYDLIEEAGRGADAEVGVRIPKTNGVRPFVGGYYYRFSKTNDNMGGVMGGVDVPVGPYLHFLVRDSYDNIHHNTALATVRVEFGGISNKANADTSVESRLLDLIPRHIGTLYTGSGIPSERDIIDTGRRSLERSNIWFFNPSSNGSAVDFTGATVDPNSCTAEHPCNGDQFNQANVNAINGFAPDANFYLGAGGYNAHGRISMNQGQNLFGRTSDFTLPAYFRNSYARITGGLDLLGNNFVEAIQMLNDGQQNEGIAINNAANIELDHDIVGQPFATQGLAADPSNYPNGIIMKKASNVVIKNSIFYAVGGADNWVGFLPNGKLATGISMEDSTGVQIQDSTINIQDNSENEQTVALGVFDLNSDFQMSNTTVNVETAMDATTPDSEGYVDVASGALVMGGNANINNDKFNLKAKADNDVDSVAGVGSSHQTVRAIVAGVAAGDIPAIPGLGEALAGFMPKGLNQAMKPTNVNVNNSNFQEEGDANSNGNNQKDYVSMLGVAAGADGNGAITTLTSANNIFGMVTKLWASGNFDNIQAAVNALISGAALNGGQVTVKSTGDVGNEEIDATAATGTADNNIGMDDDGPVAILAEGNGSNVNVAVNNDNLKMTADLANSSTGGTNTVQKTGDISAKAANGGVTKISADGDKIDTAITATASDVTAEERVAVVSAQTDGTSKATINATNDQLNLALTVNATAAANVTAFGALAQGPGAVENLGNDTFNQTILVNSIAFRSMSDISEGVGVGVVDGGTVNFTGNNVFNIKTRLNNMPGDCEISTNDGGTIDGSFQVNCE